MNDDDLLMTRDERRRYVIEQCERYGWNTGEILGQIEAAEAAAAEAAQ